MLTHNLDVEERSQWLRTTPGALALCQPYYCIESGLFYGRAQYMACRSVRGGTLLFYTLEGAGLIEHDGSQILLEPGMALILEGDQVERCRTAPGQSGWHHYWALVGGSGVQALEPVICPDKRLAPIPLPREEALPLWQALLDGTGCETAESAVSQALVIHQILAKMARQQLTGEAGQANRQLIQEAVAYIRAHFDEPLCLDGLLTNAHISKSYFLRLFRQYMGTTPYNFLLCYRITRAKELLAQTDLPVGMVAHQVGFGDESNFSTRFTAMVGQSPLRYRKSTMRSK